MLSGEIALKITIIIIIITNPTAFKILAAIQSGPGTFCFTTLAVEIWNNSIELVSEPLKVVKLLQSSLYALII